MALPPVSLPGIVVTPNAAASAYGRVDSGAGGLSGNTDFGGVLSRALHGVVDAGSRAETASMQAISGQGDITQVVTAVAKAELALQTTVAVRDRVVQAYQDIMRMPI
jgi:flagellar hook-basal body complex protein FliE